MRNTSHRCATLSKQPSYEAIMPQPSIYPRTSTSYLIIHVNDINDHAPVFPRALYTATLAEDAPIGTFVVAPIAR